LEFPILHFLFLRFISLRPSVTVLSPFYFLHGTDEI
jgi:hypothetical protein